jgi:hypothetical protein
MHCSKAAQEEIKREQTLMEESRRQDDQRVRNEDVETRTLFYA